MAVPVLKIEIDELRNSIAHLERSNRELKELLQVEPDPEYRLAIGENITTIAKKRARVAALEDELRRLTGEENCASEGVTLPVDDSGSGPSGAGAVGASTASTAADGNPNSMLTDQQPDLQQPGPSNNRAPADMDTEMGGATGRNEDAAALEGAGMDAGESDRSQADAGSSAGGLWL